MQPFLKILAACSGPVVALWSCQLGLTDHWVISQRVFIWTALTVYYSASIIATILSLISAVRLDQWGLALWNQDSLAAVSEYWSRIWTEILYRQKKGERNLLPVSFCIPSEAHGPEPQTGEIRWAQQVTDWLHLVFSKWPQGPDAIRHAQVSASVCLVLQARH